MNADSPEPKFDIDPAGEEAVPEEPLEGEGAGSEPAEGLQEPAEASEADASEADAVEALEGEAVEADAGDPAGEIQTPAGPAAGEVARSHLKGLIEALVFVSDHPVAINEIARAAGKADKKLVRVLVDELKGEYAMRGVRLEEVAGGLIFRSNPAYAPFVRDVAARRPVRMTRAQLETLAIIAYRQPITRPEVDDIRGVDSGPVLKMLRPPIFSSFSASRP
jgi:segregation and condensation protein B